MADPVPIATPDVTQPLVDADDVMQFLGGDETVKPLHLEQWVNGLSTFIRRYIDGPIETALFTETLDGTGENTIMLSYRPVVDIESVTIDDEAVDLDEVISYSHGELWAEDGFISGVQNVTVEYNAGYGTTVPTDLKLAVMLILEQASQTSLLQQATRGEYAFVFAPTKWPADARQIIDSYRRKR